VDVAIAGVAETRNGQTVFLLQPGNELKQVFHLEAGTSVFTFAVVTVGVFKDGIDLSRVDDKNYRQQPVKEVATGVRLILKAE
jgi:hypothetical protein